MSDDEIIREAVEAFADGAGILPTDLQAKVIANAYHGGQSSALYSFTSTGAIDGPAIGAELLPFDGNPEIQPLRTYTMFWGPTRGPQPGWSGLTW